MARNIKTSLHDIYDCIESIESYLGEARDFDMYKSNKLLRRGIERELEIIGEAMNRILKIDANFKITNARKIVDFRNFVIHEYDEVDFTQVWSIIIRDLPNLKLEIKNLLNN